MGICTVQGRRQQSRYDEAGSDKTDTTQKLATARPRAQEPP